MRRSTLPALALLLAAAAAPLRAQLVQASAVQGWTDHELLRDPRGLDVRASLGGGRVRLELGWARLGSSGRGTGVACAGLIDPTRCPEEPLAREARLTAVTLAAPIELLRGGRWSLAVVPEAGLARARGDVRGQTTGNHLESAERLVVLGGGALVRFRPLPLVPLQLHAGAHAQRLRPLQREQVVDGYTPFADGFGLRRLEVGVTIGLPGSLP